MTSEKVISILHAIKECRMAKYMDLCPGDCMDCEYMTGALDLSDACNIAINALRKQIIKKPLNIQFIGSQYNDIFSGLCPKCGKMTNSEYNFCQNCGQALDWD